MPQHDPTPAEEAQASSAQSPFPEGSVNLPEEGGIDQKGSGYATRTARREAVVDGWRQDMLAHLVSPVIWIGLALAYVAILIAAVFTRDLMIGGAIGLLGTIIAWAIWWKLSTRDQHFRRLASLTPVVDRTTLRGEATILAAAVDALSATLNNARSNADTRLKAMQVVLSAAAPIMSRGNVTPQQATVEGYPAWPEIDRTEMPGQEGDFLSVHLIRIDATAKRLNFLMNEEVLFEETVANIAAEVVPPLRAMEAVVEASREPADATDA